MSGITLERTRATLESIELKEQAILEELNMTINGQKSKVQQQHRINALTGGIAEDNHTLELFFKDINGAFHSEIEQMKGPDMFNSFYDAVMSTREYYTRFPHLNVETAGSVLPDPQIPLQFSGEEVFGKYLDLHSFFLQYSNLPNIPSHDQDYLQYLDKFNTFFYIPENCKNTKQYRVYVSGLWEYLSGFFSRVQPLVNLDELIASWVQDFDANWAAGKVQGWKKPGDKSTTAPQALRLGMFNSVEELEALGLDRLKSALEALGLKCGGTLKDRAERLWSVRGKKVDDIPQKLKAGPSKGMTTSSNGTSDAASSWQKEVCLFSVGAFFSSFKFNF